MPYGLNDEVNTISTRRYPPIADVDITGKSGENRCVIHDLRHSFASHALALGESLPALGGLLGHAQMETTARYAHLVRDSVRGPAERVADSIAADILKGFPCRTGSGITGLCI